MDRNPGSIGSQTTTTSCPRYSSTVFFLGDPSLYVGVVFHLIA